MHMLSLGLNMLEDISDCVCVCVCAISSLTSHTHTQTGKKRGNFLYRACNVIRLF